MCCARVARFPADPRASHCTQRMAPDVREAFHGAGDTTLPSKVRQGFLKKFLGHVDVENQCAMHTCTRPHPRACPHSHPRIARRHRTLASPGLSRPPGTRLAPRPPAGRQIDKCVRSLCCCSKLVGCACFILIACTVLSVCVLLCAGLFFSSYPPVRLVGVRVALSPLPPPRLTRSPVRTVSGVVEHLVRSRGLRQRSRQ